MGDRVDLLESATMIRVKGDDGIMTERLMPTRYTKDGKRYFAIATTYAFPINNMQDMLDGGSVTVLRVTVPVDTEEQEAYAAIRQFIREKLELCPAAICLRLGFHEVVGVKGLKVETAN